MFKHKCTFRVFMSPIGSKSGLLLHDHNGHTSMQVLQRHGDDNIAQRLD